MNSVRSRVRGTIAGVFMPLRRRHGMNWRRDIPSVDELIDAFRGLVVAAAFIALVLCAYALADLITRRGDLEAELAAQRQATSDATAMLAECMNGRAWFLHPNTTGRGYSQTVVVCEPAYLFDI